MIRANFDKRLKSLEQRAAQTGNPHGYLTLDEWKTYYATGALPVTPAAQQFLALTQPRLAEAAATLVLYEDDPTTLA